MSGMDSTGAVRDQVVGSVVSSLKEARLAELGRQYAHQDKAFSLACEQMQQVRDFIGKPEAILGSVQTKHGEIAEQVEVGVRNARQAIAEGLQDESAFRATFNGVGRIAPEDYLIDGVEVQSKFINGINANLEHVLKHLDKYPTFADDRGFYHIPKDHWQTIRDVLDGKPNEELSDKTLRAIREKVAVIEQQTQRTFDDVVRPGVSDYAEVQLGKIEDTLNGHDRALEEQNDARKSFIYKEHQPSYEEAMRVISMGAAFGGAFALGSGIYRQYRDGKNLFKGDFTAEDWQALGLDTFKGAAVGGISAGAIYTLTNYAAMNAPFASALVTATKGVGSLALSLQRGEIDVDTFTDLGLIVCAESAVVGAMSVAGQALIPVPVLGALIGSLSGKFLVSVAKNLDAASAQILQQRMEAFQHRLDEFERQTLDRILAEFTALGELTAAAFNAANNRQLLEASITLAQAYGVDEAKIIKNAGGLDAFMMA